MEGQSPTWSLCFRPLVPSTKTRVPRSLHLFCSSKEKSQKQKENLYYKNTVLLYSYKYKKYRKAKIRKINNLQFHHPTHAANCSFLMAYFPLYFMKMNNMLPLTKRSVIRVIPKETGGQCREVLSAEGQEFPLML